MLRPGEVFMHRRWRNVCTIAATGFVLLGYLVYELRANSRIAPPRESCTVAELAAKVPPPRRLAIVTDNGEQRLVWIGAIPAFTVRSGPPYYIFDTQGQLIDWCAESGEGRAADKLVSAAYEAANISLKDALHWGGAK